MRQNVETREEGAGRLDAEEGRAGTTPRLGVPSAAHGGRDRRTSGVWGLPAPRSGSSPTRPCCPPPPGRLQPPCDTRRAQLAPHPLVWPQLPFHATTNATDGRGNDRREPNPRRTEGQTDGYTLLRSPTALVGVAELDALPAAQIPGSVSPEAWALWDGKTSVGFQHFQARSPAGTEFRLSPAILQPSPWPLCSGADELETNTHPFQKQH